MGTNGVGKEEVTTALGRGRMSGHVRGARPRMGPADGVHERGQWRVGHERGQWRAGHMSGANGGWRTNVFQLKCGVKMGTGHWLMPFRSQFCMIVSNSHHSSKNSFNFVAFERDLHLKSAVHDGISSMALTSFGGYYLLVQRKFDKIDIRQQQESIHSAILRKMEHIFGKIVQYSRPNLSIFFGMMMKVDSFS
uniref:Uncharacterized protein n=1 Tax=Globodera rostochiensis TaxID=31243 RepID=A0A914HM31_GLORO